MSTVRNRPDYPRLRLLLDVDTGVDDAIAITLASRLPNVHIEAITVVAGNGNLSAGYDNTLRTLNAIDRTDVRYRQRSKLIGVVKNSNR